MRAEDAPRRGAKSFVGERFDLEHVESGTSEMPALERIGPRPDLSLRDSVDRGLLNAAMLRNFADEVVVAIVDERLD